MLSAPQTLHWEIVKADNTIKGSIQINDWTYGSTPNSPSGLEAANGTITYRYYTEDGGTYTEISAPSSATDAGTYYVAGYSDGDNNWNAQQSDYAEFDIIPAEIPFNISIPSVKLKRNSSSYTGEQISPVILNKPDESLVTVSGIFSATEIGEYPITFSLNDKANYRWHLTDGLASEDQTLSWSIIGSPLTMTLNDEQLTANQFEALTRFKFGDTWSVSINEGYSFQLFYTTNEGSSTTNDTGKFTVSPKYYSFEFRIRQNGQQIYSKTINVDHDIFDSVTAGDVSMTFEDFVSAPAVEYGTTVTFNLKAEYVDLFTFSANPVSVTKDTTVTITYGEFSSFYKAIDITCIFKPVESFTVGSKTVPYDEFVANPVVLYGEFFKINMKAGYEGFWSTFSEGTVTNDFTVSVLSPGENETVSIDISCDRSFLSDIALGGKTLTFDELHQISHASLGSVLSFTVNDAFSEIYSVSVQENYSSSQQTITGEYSFTFDSVSSYLQISLLPKNGVANSYLISLSTRLIESITINDKEFVLDGTYFIYEKERNETSFTILLDETLVSEYKLYYDIDGIQVRITQPSVTLSAEESGNELYFGVQVDNVYRQVLTIRFAEFTPLKSIKMYYSTGHYADWKNWENENQYNLPAFNIEGVITNIEVTYKDNYSDCTYKIFDPQGTEIQNFTSAVSGTYTLKAYLNGEEIYSTGINISYDPRFLFPDATNVQDANVLVLFTHENTLNTVLEDTNYFTDQTITFDGQESIALAEGQNIVSVVYKVTVNNLKYTFAFDLYVEYLPSEDSASNYVNDIIIHYTDQWGNYNTAPLDPDCSISSSLIKLDGLLRMNEDDIEITPRDGNTVLSKQIVVSEEANWLCCLEFTIETAENVQKTYRIYISTYGTVSDNTDVKITFKDEATPKHDVTSQIQNDTLTIEKVNISGTIGIQPDDVNAYLQFFFNGAPLENVYSYSLDLNEVGTYTVEITSSDNTATRTITIIVEEYNGLILEAFYNGERLYMENGNPIPVGNMIFSADENDMPILLGYFNDKKPEDTNTVTLTGNTVYANRLYTSDMTQITDLNNIVLPLLTDTDGSITQIAGAEYALIYAFVDDETRISVYFVFEQAPPYPMTFGFDTDGNGTIDENDTVLNLKLNMEELQSGTFDLGDFFIENDGPVIKVTREQLGMGADDTSVTATVVWAKTYDDLSYRYATELPSDGSAPQLIGPTEENLQSDLTLSFINTDDGSFTATVYVCCEGATENTLLYTLVPVVFELTN